MAAAGENAFYLVLTIFFFYLRRLTDIVFLCGACRAVYLGVLLRVLRKDYIRNFAVFV